MTARLLTALAALSLASGCVVYNDNDGPDRDPVYVNYTPTIAWADSGCYWDDYNQDFIWWFEAEVYDDNGRTDLTGVYADIYDPYGNFIDSFELYRETPDPDIWFSDWLQYSTNVDCYYGGYQVDFIAYDTYEDWDVVTVIPQTY
ncbi:MAG: hypothetical protein VX899_02640 [Myxococcota bacterium]|nr:hypothetical protein [Myxococcota bacterium]